ncbi:hypothetical protein Tsubulata_013719 [Turnera subulata]|uniref:Anaphase-promoting complex subunit 7 n=1 Tax=Turnera subulata TaxID=218843 RepID=A0A9Q0FR71_9ROSI|nr:hypothetical protein Tsubulata_013719 [Turnera subulata]
MDVPKDQITTLLDQELYNSAQILGSFLVSSPSVSLETSPHIKAENQILLGDAFFRDREFRRAIVKFKIASCLSALNETRAALVEMEGIPSKARTLQMSLLMAKLYRNSRHNRFAVACYKECLRQCPYVIEAIIALAELGVAAKDIVSFLSQTSNKSGRAPFDHTDSNRWLQVVWNSLMDEYAMLLKIKSDYSKLNKLAHDLLNIDSTRPEVYVALAVLAERKDGNLLLSMKRPELAVVAFRVAQELRPDLRSYQGLVHSYLAFSKFKEALHASREAMKAMPQSAKALKLVGDVHASNSGGREKAKKFYESALRLEPGYLGAALALAELHVIEGRNGDAVSLLERYLKDWADDSLHVKLAQVFAATNMLQEALSHYQAALRINSQNEAAKKGLERLEKQMKGVDPDAPEEDEENEVEDADGDQEETELL